MQAKGGLYPLALHSCLCLFGSYPFSARNISHSSLFSFVLPATREAEVSWNREERERRDRGAMVTQTMSPVTGSPESRVTLGPCDYNADLVLTTLLWFVSSIGSSLVNIVNSRNSFVTF